MTPPTARSPLKLRTSGRRRAAIGLTPLIDVVFILLVFFMLASSFLDWRAIQLQAPATAGRTGSETGAILLRIAPDGGLDLNGRPVDLARLGARLADLGERRGTARVLIQPAADVAMQRTVDVLDAVRAAGAGEVRLLRGAGGGG